MELDATATGDAQAAPEQAPAVDATMEIVPDSSEAATYQQAESEETMKDESDAVNPSPVVATIAGAEGDAVQASGEATGADVEAVETQVVDGGSEKEHAEEMEVPGSDVSTPEEVEVVEVKKDEANEVDAGKPEPEVEAVTEVNADKEAAPVVDATGDVKSSGEATKEKEAFKDAAGEQADAEVASAVEEITAEVVSTVEKESSEEATTVVNTEQFPPAHDESEYDPTASSLDVSVSHGEDEYDPANPSPAGTPIAVNAPTNSAISADAADREAYDPDHPSISTSSATGGAVPMEVDEAPQSKTSEELPAATPAKRKVDEAIASSSETPATGALGKDASTTGTESKRPRYDDSSKSSPRVDDDHKHSHRHRSGESSSSPSTSRHKRRDEDHKGLSPAAWDRLMDFQSISEFRVTQVSRAAFASVGAMPEFAQIAVIARFVRTPLQDIRDKNGQLMRIYREYQKENPQVAALQPVNAFISDYKSDPGLFRFGYAPPQPLTGVSSVRVPYQRDQQDNAGIKTPTRQAAGTPSNQEPKQKDVDEFGRSLNHDNAAVIDPAASRAPATRAAADPRLRNRPGASTPSGQPEARPSAVPRAEDPRRRDQAQPGTNGAARDPRRRGSASNQSSPRGGQTGVPRPEVVSDLFGRLPPPVKAILDNMHRDGRLHQTLNDNVISRLLHLPERVALQAVENFSNVDLSQVGNLQGFLVGIINRVQEKSFNSEKQHRQVSPRGQMSSGPGRGGSYSIPTGGPSVLGGPPPGGRIGEMNGANGGGYHGQGGAMAAPTPALYERPYDAPQDPRRRQPVPQGGAPAYGGAVHGPPGGRGPSGGVGMQSFVALPPSVQNHVQSLVANGTLVSVEELGAKCYEVLGQLSEPLANQVLTRFAGANLANVRNRSGFLIGVVKRCRQEYGFNN